MFVKHSLFRYNDDSEIDVVSIDTKDCPLSVREVGLKMVYTAKYVTKKGEEKWLVKVDLGKDFETGKRKQTTKRNFLSKDEALQFAYDIQTQRGQSDNVYRGSCLFELVLERWFEAYKKTGVKKSTLSCRETIGIPHLRKFFGNILIRKITCFQYEAFLHQKIEEKYAYWSIYNIHVVAKLVFAYAEKMQYIDSNPVKDIKIPVQRKTIEQLRQADLEGHYLEKEEVTRLLSMIKAIDPYLDYALFTFLAYTGVRIGEALALKWEDVNLETGEVRIYKNLYRAGNRIRDFELTTPKTSSSNRRFFIDKQTISILKKFMSFQTECKLLASHYLEEDFIFAKVDGNDAGYPERRHSLDYRLKKYLRQAKITKNITLHKFRHTHISLLAQAGVDITQIQSRVGHSDSKVTKEIYLHVTREAGKEIAKSFANLFQEVI